MDKIKNGLLYVGIALALLLVVGLSVTYANYDMTDRVEHRRSEIFEDQKIVQEWEPKVLSAKSRVEKNRHFICDEDPEYCKKEILDPLNVSADLSSFLK